MAGKHGRPSTYSDDYLDKVKEYIDGGYRERGSVIPSLAGLSLYIGVPTTTMGEWRARQPEFSAMLNELMAKQQELLLDNGLSGKFNPTITKLVLSKHGYHERIEQTVDHTSGGKAIQPATFKGVAAEKQTRNPSKGWNALDDKGELIEADAPSRHTRRSKAKKKAD